MPICPYCTDELRLKLTAQFIADIDDNYYRTIEAQINRIPRMLRGVMKSQMSCIQQYPMMVEMLVCSACNRVLGSEIQRIEHTGSV
ncbi:MAG: hypothetical protein JSU57_03180 [Candidatus Heimdallarchaeota archaeon]|nr:MAG: hypothetical protein JSU57_03180 [Candidatus Heimdallarchaeota archaeon]